MNGQDQRVLVVEDEAPMRTVLADALGAAGFRVLTAADGEAGLKRALDESPDLILLDVMMPRLDGFAVAAELRRLGREVPILMLTAKGQVEDRVRGLDHGADDYLVKPFSTGELLARVRALMRRTDGATTVLQAGGLRLDLLTRGVSGATPDGADIELSEREAALLATLMAAPTRIFSRARLLDTVFIGVDSDGTIDLNVHYLRRKLGKTVIRTVHGAGYRFGLE
jgi:DNA-binding response OmpR family regulator